jgi:hypothetical protein
MVDALGLRGDDLRGAAHERYIRKYPNETTQLLEE